MVNPVELKAGTAASKKPARRKMASTVSGRKSEKNPDTINKPSKISSTIADSKPVVDELPSLLSVPQLAELLHINEKKVYQLAAEGDIPCTKVTGKWLFPKQMVQDWIEQSSAAGTVADRLVLSGADDLLIDRLCRRTTLDLGRSATLCYLPSGSMHGLRLLAARRVDGCFFHWGVNENSARRHLGLLRSFKEHSQWVTVRCLYRNEGIAFSPQSVSLLNNKLKDFFSDGSEQLSVQSKARLLKLLASEKVVWAQRHHESGTQRLLEDICYECGLQPDRLGADINYYAGEHETASAVAHNQAGVALTSEAVASEYGLQFVTINRVAIDLVLSRKTYFRPLVQTLLKKLLLSNDSVQHQWHNSYEIPSNHEINVIKSD